MPGYEGRLELTWTNKHLRLLAHEDGKYEWLEPSDYRVAEVRLLHDVTTVGTVEKRRAADNLLIRGDALHALTSIARLPEFAREYLGKVKLAYLDPPFNTQQSFLQYDDALEHSVWLTMMRDRLLQIRDLLVLGGTVWLHLDDSEVHRARCVLDEVFGPENFVATFIWERTDIPAMQAEVSIRHDYIHVYSKGPEVSFNGFLSEDVAAHYDRTDESGRPYCLRTLRMTGPGSSRADRPTMWYPLTAPDGTQVWPLRSDGSEGRWRWGPQRYADSAHLVEWQQKPDGSWEAYRRIYADREALRPPETLWRYTEVGANRNAKLELRALFPGLPPFATPKPERLLQRIVHIGSNPRGHRA
jgi:adenine-specific DNA-methyltransferase